MTNFNLSSRCEMGRPVRFRWYGFPQASPGADLETATQIFLGLIRSESLESVLNPYLASMAKKEFERRIKRASEGKLHPMKEVKSVDVQNPPPLFEIRWQGISVRTVEAGVLKTRSLLIRMYHSEPLEAPDFFIGHHIHIKRIGLGGETNQLQNVEIEVAKNYFYAGLRDFWGIPLVERQRTI